MLPLERNGLSAQQVREALHMVHGVSRMRFRYDLLDSNNQFKRTLTNVLSASVTHDALADIKRRAKFTIVDDGTIDFLSDRIKPYVLLDVPASPNVPGSKPGVAEFPLGVFLLTTPPRKARADGSVIREVEAYDLGQVLRDDKVTDRYTVPAGTNYIKAVSDVLTSAGITMQNLAPTDKVLPADRDWEPGTSKAQIVNDLLAAINYFSLWFDGDGYAVAQPYTNPASRPVDYVYRDDEESVILPEVEQALDLFDVPNRWVVYTSEADGVPLRSVYTNDNPSSPTSTVRRGRVITAPPIQVEAPDQETLDAIARRIAFEQSQVYEKVQFETAIMPIHTHMDVLRFEFKALGLSENYLETGWSFDLKVGARMKHTVRRLIYL